MTDKDRLEEIKNNITSNEVDSVNLHVADFVWLIEQTERVLALEFYKQDWMIVTEQNKHYREELDILGEVINSAPNADKLNEEYERLKGLEGESQ